MITVLAIIGAIALVVGGYGAILLGLARLPEAPPHLADLEDERDEVTR